MTVLSENSQDLCGNCGINVYQAESMLAAGRKWHKACFKCGICQKFLSSGNCNVLKGVLLCKHCLEVVSRPQGPIAYYDTRSILADDCQNGYDKDGCLRCRGKVFEAEKMMGKWGLYHKRCFTCKICQRPMDATNFVNYNMDVFCTGCHTQYLHMRSKSIGPSSTDTSLIKANPQDRDCCPRCGGAVFEAEKIISKRHFYHQNCISCNNCARKLDASTFFDAPDGEVYCRGCYSTSFGHRVPRAKSCGPPQDTRSILGIKGDSSTCPICSGRVFEAEKSVARSGWYHKSCFKCYRCQHLLNATNFNDGPDNKIYCRGCYKITTEVIDDSIFARSIVDTDIISSISGRPSCPRCKGAVFEAEKMVSKYGSYHRNCFTCFECRRFLDPLLMMEYSGNIFCPSCYKKSFGYEGQNYSTVTDVNTVKADHNDSATACIRCHYKVYDLEAINVDDKALYHKKCFTCLKCTKKLDGNSSDSTQKQAFIASDGSHEVYCRKCYVDVFGDNHVMPSTWSDVSAIRPNDGKGCPRCGGAVFKAEEIIEKGRNFHKQCFSCKTCNKNLTDKLQVFIGFDEEIYCKVCYPKIMHINNMNHVGNTTAIKAHIGEKDACPRCQGKVFEAEKMISKDRYYHKRCFNCNICKKSLDYYSVFETQRPKHEIFCKTCYIDNYFTGGKNSYLQMSSYNNNNNNVSKGRTTSDSDHCPKCGGQVFKIEGVLTSGAIYHRQCLSCDDCNRTLDPSTFVDSRTGVLCHGCYEKKFGRRSRSRSRPPIDPAMFQAQEGELQCPTCLGKIFEAEKCITSYGCYHRQCFKCKDCNKNLTSSPAYRSEIDKKLYVYCKACYSENHEKAPSDVNLTKAIIETSAIPASIDDPDGCVRCSGKVFEAEKVNVNGFSYHSKCLTCKNCKQRLDSRSLCSINKEVYCNGCYSRISGGGYRVGGGQWINDQESIKCRPIQYVNPSVIKADKDEESCHKCRGKVFELERIISNSVKNPLIYHKNCFNCNACNKNMDSPLITYIQGSDDQIYCKRCYQGINYCVSDDNLTTHNRGYADPRIIQAEFGDKSACPRCNGKVFEVEKILTSKRAYHKMCFSCRQCRHKLDGSNFMEGPNEEIYCKTCYVAEYFTGKNKFGEARATQMIKDAIDDSNNCPRCGFKVFEAEKLMTSVGSYHPACFKCYECKRDLDQSSACSGIREIYCKLCYSEEYGVNSRSVITRSRSRATSMAPPEDTPDAVAQAAINTTSIMADAQDTNKCPRCNGKVFEAEKIACSSGSYHKKCFCCSDCHRALDSTLVCCTESDIYCKNCYSKSYGPTVRHFNQNDALKAVQQVRKATGNSTDRSCPRCRGTVYAIEEIYSNGRSYHRQCAKCRSCDRSLDFNTIYDGPDRELYCKGCYSRKYGASGFRGIGSNTWTDEEASMAQRPNIFSDTRTIVSDDLDGCIRCRGKVFDAEKCIAAHGIFHKTCFRCASCQINLDSTNCCDAPNKEIYCRNCYSKCFGFQGYGYGNTVAMLHEQTNNKSNVQQYHFTSFF